MKYPYTMRSALVAAALGAGVVFAQTAAAPAVVTDTAPPPAEDRSSVGAVVLERSPVPAQRAVMTQRAASQADMGRGILRATVRAQAEADLAKAREDENADTRRMGAPAAPKR